MPPRSDKSILKIVLSTLIMVVAVFGLAMTGCKKKQEDPVKLEPQTQVQHEVVIYFSKDAGNHSITEGVIRSIPETHDESLMSLAIEELLKGPNKDESIHGYYSEIPKGTRLLGVTEENGEIHVNLSKQFTIGGGSNSQKQRADELKRTILSLSDGAEVYIEIEGEKISALNGEGLEIPNPVEQPIQ